MSITPKQAKEWLYNLDRAHLSACQMIEYSAWAVSLADKLFARVETGDNVFSIKDKTALVGDMPSPPEGFINFEKSGAELDQLIKNIKALLSEESA